MSGDVVITHHHDLIPGADSPVPADQGAGDGVARGLSRPDQVLHAGEGDM